MPSRPQRPCGRFRIASGPLSTCGAVVPCVLVEFGVLGPLEVRRNGRPVTLPGGKPRTLLARLLVDAGRVVSVDALAEAIWPERPPTSPTAAIQVHVSNLRRALGATVIETRAPGYALALEGIHLDHEHLATAVAASRRARTDGRAEEALGLARRAVSLVRGEPYAEFVFDEWAQSEVLRVRGLVLAAHEEVHAALLDLGRHHDAIPALEALVAAHPFHERLRAQLMLALYRDGRQAESLRCYADGRARLVEELGVEPGPELRQMEARVLGHDEQLLVDRPVTVAPPTVVERVGAAGLVGRRAETDALRVAWREARDGHVRVVLLGGEPGIGKSALARWVAESAAAEGAIVGLGAAEPHAGAPPYWPWTSALRDLAARIPAGRFDAAISETPGAGLVAELLTGGATDVGAGQQFLLFDAVVRLLERLAGTAPVVLALDDLQWSDDASLDLVRFTARARSGTRLLVVAAHRPPTDGDAVSALVADLTTEPAARRLVVRGLPVDDVRRLVGQLTDGPAAPAVADAIAAATGGNPFYVRELVGLLRVDQGVLDPTRAAVPDTVRAALRRRAEQLGEHAVDVLTLAAIGGGDVDDGLIAGVLGIDRSVVAALLDEAAHGGLVVEVEGRPGHHRFAHDIVRHAFADAVPQRRRAESHLALARALVDDLGDRAPARATEIATHFAQATDVGGAAEAVRWLREAAALAVRSGAYGDAIRSLRRATFVARSRLADDRTECEVLVELAAAARLAADPATARVARDAARRLATRLGDEVLVARATEVLLGPGPHWIKRAR